MKKIEKRALLCLLLSGALVLGLCIFSVRFFVYGSQWASFSANQHLYAGGGLSRGAVLDRNGVVLAETKDGKRQYNEDKSVRMATLHAVGDSQGRIGTGVQTRLAGKLSGYNPVTGVSVTGGTDITLTLDSQLCATAYEALNGAKGTVGVYNYKTGEILCMVSTPTYDPQNPPEISDDDPAYEGVYLNRFLSASVVPGSIFKTVTTAAAIQNMDDLMDRTFHCDGETVIGGAKITCPKAHGDLTIGEAFTVSCNCVYGQLASELGADTMEEVTEKAGLMDSISVSGIDTAKGSFDFDDKDKGSLAWAGIGQDEDLLNPCAMMTFMGAVANGGKAALPQLVLDGGGLLDALGSKQTGELIDGDTAATLSSMMRDNVLNNYGEGKLEGLNLCAKSGTAQVGGDKTPNAWFTGFLQSEEQPLAFIVLVENGGSGSQVAGKVAKQVLAAAVGR